MCICLSTESVGQLSHLEEKEKLCHTYKRVKPMCIQTIHNCHHGLLVLPGDNILFCINSVLLAACSMQNRMRFYFCSGILSNQRGLKYTHAQ